jgi:DNA-directed RNA polymerase specialized sigma subunit
MNEKPLDSTVSTTMKLPAPEPINKEPQALFQTWKRRPGPETLTPLLTSLQPVIDKSLKTYGYEGDPLMQTTAQLHAIKVLGNYQPERGARLETFMTNEMRRLQRLGAQQSQVIPIPERVALDYKDIQQAEAKLKSELGRDPTISELADTTGLSVKRIGSVRKRHVPVRMEGMFQTEEGYGSAPGTQRLDTEQLWIEAVYGDLGPVDQKIVDWSLGWHGEPKMEKTDMARRLGISIAAISQRAKKIADRLQEGAKIQLL